MKVVLRRKLRTLYVYSGRKERSEINYLKHHLKKLEEEQIKSKIKRSKEAIRIKAEINKIKMKTTQKINETIIF